MIQASTFIPINVSIEIEKNLPQRAAKGARFFTSKAFMQKRKFAKLCELRLCKHNLNLSEICESDSYRDFVLLFCYKFAKSNVGLDAAVGKGDWGIYFRIDEAF